ncbi:unnamed protein product [Nesidiocoris tenuis]|uniref:RNA-directed DNA polymerase n=1 Tax=Nesidiocoris tenuis TaxID=355587 RepID=A0A6H5GVC8_9HEMI|nr:unnamed protein product [Nesidiocoris tenuis]
MVDYINYVHENSPFRIKWRVIRNETRLEPELSKVFRCVQTGDEFPPEKQFQPYRQRAHQLTIERDCLMWGYRIIVPLKFRKTVLEELHKNHFGSSKMKSMARSFFWWPSLDHDIEMTAQKCSICAKFRSTPPRSTLHTWPTPPKVWTRLHADFLGPINKQYCFVVMDPTSRWIENFFVSSATAHSAIEKLEETFARFGLPRAITTDGAKCFVGEEFSAFLNRFGIMHLKGPPFHPTSNGQAESAVKIIKTCIKKALANKQPVSRSVNQFLFQYRNTEHQATKETPANMLLKWKPLTVFDQMRPSTEELNLGRQVNLMKHGGKRNIDIDKESEVWVRSYRQGEPAWIKGTVLDRLGNQTFQIQTKGNQPWTRHNDQIWPIRKSTDGSVLKKVNPDPSDSPDVGDSHQPTPILDDLPNIDEPPNCDETPSINESPNTTPMNRRSQRTRKKKVQFSP